MRMNLPEWAALAYAAIVLGNAGCKVKRVLPPPYEEPGIGPVDSVERAGDTVPDRWKVRDGAGPDDWFVHPDSGMCRDDLYDANGNLVATDTVPCSQEPSDYRPECRPVANRVWLCGTTETRDTLRRADD